MQRAIEQARAGIRLGQTPFGAVVVHEGRVIAAGHNEVWLRGDPTAHAEIVAIQRAAAALKSIRLDGCRMFTTCEPCPMCAAAIHWSRLDAVYFGASIADAQRAGFRELVLACDELYRRGESPVRVVPGVLAGQCAALFDEWRAAGQAREY